MLGTFRVFFIQRKNKLNIPKANSSSNPLSKQTEKENLSDHVPIFPSTLVVLMAHIMHYLFLHRMINEQIFKDFEMSIRETNEIYLLCIEETKACWHSFYNFDIQLLNN